MRLVGDYRYGACEVDGVRYAIIKNNECIERIRVIQEHGNPVLWRDGDHIDDLILNIMMRAVY
jgi:hypothetical protein